MTIVQILKFPYIHVTCNFEVSAKSIMYNQKLVITPSSNNNYNYYNYKHPCTLMHGPFLVVNIISMQKYKKTIQDPGSKSFLTDQC